MKSNLIFTLFLLCSSWVFPGFSFDLNEESMSTLSQDLEKGLEKQMSQGVEGLDKQISQGVGSLFQDAAEKVGISSSAADSLPCMQKLMPCQPFLLSTSPPASCCMPLKEMIAGDAKCLCDIFNNAEILKTLNITQEDALKLPKACGDNVDISICKNANTTSPTTPSTPATPDNGSSTTDSKSSAHYGISQFGGSGLIVSLMALIFSGF